MFLLHFSRWEEAVSLLARPSENWRPIGTLAAEIIQTAHSNPATRRETARALSGWMDGLVAEPSRPKAWKVAVSQQTKTDLELVRAQFYSWLENRGGDWDHKYTDLDGAPTDELNCPAGRRLMNGIRWRRPAKHGIETVFAASPESAVLLSAVYGFMRDALTPCMNCGALLVIGRQRQNLRSCPECGARFGAHVSARLRRVYRLVYHRARKRGKRALADFKEKADKIVENAKMNLISEAKAIAAIQLACERGPRGRREPRL